MERKHHWSSHHFANGLVPRERFFIHFEQEYELFVRDFPILVARAYIQCPIAAVRADLAANIFEEETGQLAAGRPHPELFLDIPRGFGCDMARFTSIELLDGAKRYRAILDHHTTGRGWCEAAAVTTLFIEGTAYERGELDATAPKRPMPPIEEHPLHRHYQVPLSSLTLPAVHRQVEGDHRAAAWRAVLEHTPVNEEGAVVAAMEACLQGWLAYKDSVASAVGIAPLTT